MDNLKEYGYEFQIKVIAALITDRQFINDVRDIIDKSYFDSNALRWLCNSVISYYNEYKLLPTIEVFKIQIVNVKIELEKKEIVGALKDVFKNQQSTDLQFVKDEFHKFCVIQIYKKAILDGVELLKKQDVAAIKETFDNAFKSTQREKNTALNYKEEVDYRYKASEELVRITTGWEVVDRYLGGGLPKKKFGIVMAPTGIGKSWVLCALGAAAIQAGYKVLHYTLELDKFYTGQRYDTIMTSLPMNDLQYNIQNIKKRMTGITGDLRIEEFPPSTLTIGAFEYSIERYISDGFEPDLVILDYPELFDINYNSNMREDLVLGEFYKKLRGLAGQYNFALWGADQTNRGGSSKNIVEGDSISNAFAKLFPVDFWMSISRRPDDKLNNRAMGFIGKNRLGPDGITLPSHFDTTHGDIRFYDERSDEGLETTNNRQTNREYGDKLALDLYNNRKGNNLI